MFLPDKQKQGFTLVEILVSTALFSMVVLLSVSAVASIIDANYKARSVKIAVDNISFVLEEMTRNIRLGSKYYCNTSIATPTTPVVSTGGSKSCVFDGFLSSGGIYLSFKNRNGTMSFYQLNGTCIEQKTSSVSWTYGYEDDGNNYTCITGSDVLINRFRFYVYNAESSSLRQPYVVVVMNGTAGTKVSTQTQFSLMTSGTQRLPHDVE